MPTPVFVTIDTEFAWRHHAAGLDPESIYARSIEPAGVGIGFQLARLAEHGLKACFFVDPMPAMLYGLAPIRRVVETILAAGQEVQLHLHPGWIAARTCDRRPHARLNLNQYDADEQRSLVAGAIDLLVAAGAPRPVAFRAGSYAADDVTLAVLASLGIGYDSSHNGAAAASRIDLPRDRIAPVERNGVVEVPITVIREAPGSLRTLQLCASSSAETGDALDHAADAGHGCVTLVSHGFELCNRAGTRANAVHVRRFEALCRMLGERRAALPTTHFADRPALALDRDDRPLAPHRLRTRWRQAEQLWSNLVEERAR